MDKAYILIVDAEQSDWSHQLLHNLTCPELNAEVFVFVASFQKLIHLREEFPSAIFILLDQSKSEEVNKECLRHLPEMECFLNYSNNTFSDMSQHIPEIQIAKVSSVSKENMTLQTILQELENAEKPGTVLINVIKQTKEEVGCNISQTRGQEEVYGPPLIPIKFRFHPGSKFIGQPSTTRQPAPNESQPLLAPPVPTRTSQEESTGGCLSYIFCCCYPTNKEPTKFATPEKLRCHIRMEQTSEIRQALEKLFGTCTSDWNKILEHLQHQEETLLDELVGKVQEEKFQEENELQKKKNTENTTTESNLSGVLDPKVIEGIKKSRERQVTKKVRWDSEHAYQEGSEMIRRETETQKLMEADAHYSKVVLKQVNILTKIRNKHRQNYEILMVKNFGKIVNA